MITNTFNWGDRTFKTFNLKPKTSKRLLGGVIGMSSFIIPDLMIGSAIGLSLMSGINIKTKLKSKMLDFNTWRRLR
jgi:hypothetical protein